MQALNNLLKLAISDKTLEGLSEDQNQAVVDALLTAIFADGEVSAEERAQFEKEVTKLPWAWGNDAEKMAKAVAAAEEKLVAATQGGQQDTIAHIKGIGDRLPTPELKEKVFRMMAAIVYADSKQANELERNVLGAFTHAFGMPPERAVAIAKEVRGG
jgi:uncharacterized tellurite resistance protein B-like protein